jgi:hypothetical protein
VTLDGRALPFRVRPGGDVQRVEVLVDPVPATARLVFALDEGTEVHAPPAMPEAGSRSRGLRILRARAETGSLHLVLEGLAGRTYPIGVRTPRALGDAAGVKATPGRAGTALLVSFEGPEGSYVRRTLDLPFR